MKQVTICLSCDKTIPISLCYEAERLEHVKNMLTGQVTDQKIKGHICALCNKGMGFKTNAKKLKKLAEAQKEK